MTDPKKARENLHTAFVKKGYKGSLEDFETLYSQPDKMANLHKAMASFGYGGTLDDFSGLYFGDMLTNPDTEKKNQVETVSIGPNPSDLLPPTQSNSSGGSSISEGEIPPEETLDPQTAGPEQIPFPDPEDYQPTPEPQPEVKVDKERNPLKSLLKSAWNTGFYQMPAAISAAASTLMPDTHIEFAPNMMAAMEMRKEAKRIIGDDYEVVLEESSKQARQELLKWGLDRSQQGSEKSKALIQSADDIHDFVDFLNFAGSAVGQSAIQIPAAVLTGGATGMGQSVGGIYMDEVQKLSEKYNISPEEVIDRELDDRATAIAFGVASGMIDKIGADKVMSGIKVDFVKKSLRNRAKRFFVEAGKSMTTEGLTEGIQSIIEQSGASLGADENIKIDLKQLRDEALSGALGGGGISVASQVAGSMAGRKPTGEPVAADKTKANEEVTPPKAEEQIEVQGEPEGTPQREASAEGSVAQTTEDGGEGGRIVDEEESVLEDSFIEFAADKDAEDDQAFSDFLETIPEANREEATVRRDELVLAAKAQKIISEERAKEQTEAVPVEPETALTEDANAEDSTDVGTEAEILRDSQEVRVEPETTPANTDINQVAQEENTGIEVNPNEFDAVRTRLEGSSIDADALQEKTTQLSKAGVKVVLHDSAESVTAARGKAVEGFSKTTDTDAEIHINSMAKNADEVLDHEIAHVAVKRVLGPASENQKQRKKMASTIRKSLEVEEGSTDRIDRIGRLYEKGKQDEEFLAEAAALIASGKAKLKKSSLEKVVNAVTEMARKVTGAKISYNTSNARKRKQLFENIALAVSGKEDIKELSNAARNNSNRSDSEIEAEIEDYLQDSITQNPNYQAAKRFVQENEQQYFDKDMAQTLVKFFDYTPFEATRLMESVTGRKFKTAHPLQVENDASLKKFQQEFGAIFRRPEYDKVPGLTFKERFAQRVGHAKNAAYIIDFRVRNAGTFLRNMQKSIEKSVGLTNPGFRLPDNLNPYEQLQLVQSKAAFEIKQLQNKFFGHKGDVASRKNSFIGRLNSVGISTELFNEYLVAAHAPERYKRLIDQTDKKIRKMLDLMEKKHQEIKDKKEAAGELEAWEDVMNAYKQARGTGQAYEITAELIAAAKNLVRENSKLSRELGKQKLFLDKLYDKLAYYERYQTDVYARLTDAKRLDAEKFYHELKEEYMDPYVELLEDHNLINPARAHYLRTGISNKSDVAFFNYVPLLIKEESHAAENDKHFNPIDGNSESIVRDVNSLGIHQITGAVNYNIEDIQRPLDVIFHRMAAGLYTVHRNEAVRSLANLIKQYGSKDRATIVKSQSIPTVNELGEVVGARDYTPESVKRDGLAYRDNAGRLSYIVFKNPNDPIIAAVKAGRYSEEVVTRLLGGWVRKGNNLFRLGVTTLSPKFIISNPFRDATDAFANIESETEMSGLRAQYVKSYGESIAFFTGESIIGKMLGRNNEGSGKKMAEYWMEAQRMGARMSWSTLTNPVMQTGNLQSEIDKAERAIRSGDTAKAKSFFDNLWGQLEAASDTSENISRLAAYAALREKGVSPQKAAAVAKNITVNFEKRGASGNMKHLNGFYLFLNVGVQGAGKTIKLFTTPQGRKALALMGSYYMVNRIMLHTMIGLLGDDEEEQEFKDKYLNNTYIRSNYTLVFNPLDIKNPLRIPKPYSALRIFSTTMENLVDAAYGSRTAFDVAADMFITGGSMMDPVAGGGQSVTSYLPFTFLHPLFEVGVNENFLGSEILRTVGKDNMPDHMNYNKSTGAGYVKAADGLYKYSGRFFDISPTSMEHLANGYVLRMGPVPFAKGLSEAASEYMKTGDEFGLLKSVGTVNKKLYEDLSEKEKQDLFTFFDLSDRSGLRRLNDEQFKTLSRAVRVIKQKELAKSSTINAALTGMAEKFPDYKTRIEELK